MTALDIQKGLRNLFINNRYHLYNQYIFKHDWESDYFSMTDAGLLIEAEVKISRSDYLADFKKPRHEFYRAMFRKKSFLVENLGKSSWHGDVIAKFKTGTLYDTNPGHRGYSQRPPQHWMYSTHMQYNIVSLHAPCTRIKVYLFDGMPLPHRFYFATPPGLLKPNELPPYAGLAELQPSGACKVVKTAPVLHKRRITDGLYKTILDKYYFKHQLLITQP